MAKNQESINRSLFELLRSRGYAPTLLDTTGKEIPVPEEAEVFQFKFTKDGEEYGTVTASIDGLHKLIIYFGDDVANSEKEDNGGDDSWYKLLNHLKRFSQQHQLSFEVKNRDHLKYDMAKREHMKKQERIAEGYYPMGKKASYNDNIPTVKIVIEHSRQIEEGEQRYRNVNRIFLENTQGERILAPTTKPGVAQIYARHLAEGGMPHDDRWNHIISLCEEYNKMGAFVRATRNNQFNESAQQLVNEGINHYQSLRESLSKMRGARGYNAYFESYTPPLMEDESEENNLNELFVQETLDPRIESVMPILNKLHKKVAEMKEVNELSEWADSLTEIALEEGEIYSSPTNEAVIPDPKYDHEPPAQESDPIPDDSDHDPIPDDQEPELDEGMMDTIKKVGGKIFDKLGGGSEKDLIKNLQKSAGVEVTGKKPEFDVKAKELARSNPNNPSGNFMKGGKDLGIFKEDLDEARVFGYDIKRVPDLKVSYDDAQELKNQLGMLQKVMMYATPDDMSPEIRSQVKNIYFKITNILQRNGLQESDLMSTDEGMFDKVKDVVKTIGSKVFNKLGGGSEEDLLKDLKNKAGVRNPENGKPSMAYSDVEKRTDEVDMGQADSSLRNDPKQNNDKMDHFTALDKASKKMGHNHFMDVPDDKLEALRAMVKRFRAGEEVDESALQAYLGDKKYGKDGMDALRDAGQEHASEKTMQNIRAKYSSKEEPVTEDGEFAGDYATGEAGQWRNKGPKANKPATIGDLVGEGEEKENDTLDPWKHVSPRVDNPKIKGTDKRAKSAYYPTPKPPVKKLDTPLTNETVAEGSDDLARILNIAGLTK